MNSKIQNYLNQNKSISFNNLLFEYIDKSGLTDAEVYNKVNIDRRLFSKIRCNNHYIPKKQNIIKLCLSLNLNLIDTQRLLYSAGYTLSTNDNFDLIIKFCIENKVYNINIINDYLFTYANTILE